MSLATRAFRNVTRGRARAIGVALAVGIALSAFLILSQINNSVSANVAQARASVEDLVTVSPAGSSTFMLSGHLNNSVYPAAQKVPDINTVQRVILETPGFTPGSGGGGGGSGGFRNFTLYEGVDTTAPISSLGGFGGGSSLSVTAGRMLNASDEDRDVAIVGTTYASNNNIVPGSHISVNGTGVEVVGIFSTGTSFGGNNVILPYPAAQQAFAVTGPNLLQIEVGDPGELDFVVDELRSTLGSGVDVSAPSQDSGGGFETAIDSILSSTQFESWAALGIGAAIMVVVMALVTAARTREIGLLKAFGFGNARVLSQLVVEGLFLSLFGLPIGLLATVWLGPTVAQWVAGSASSGSGGGGRFFSGGGFASRLVGNVSFSITPEVLVLGIVVTFLFGLLGSLYPILRALRLKPAEALRNE